MNNFPIFSHDHNPRIIYSNGKNIIPWMMGYWDISLSIPVLSINMIGYENPDELSAAGVLWDALRCHQRSVKSPKYPLVTGNLTWLWKTTIYELSREKWWLSIVMLVYERVNGGVNVNITCRWCIFPHAIFD